MIVRFYNEHMPKVSPEHRAAQRQRILDAARRCFVRDGFHTTSMQDILTEAGLSAGGVYLYFKSKEEIVEAIAVDTLATFTGILDTLLRHDDLPALDVMLGRALEQLLAYDRKVPTFRVAVQIWGEVGRAPHLAFLVGEAQGRVRESFTRLVKHYQERADIDPDVSAENVAQVLITLVVGFVAQRTLLGVDDVPTFQSGFRAMLAANLRSVENRA
jgi:AcrR family transcriptional regulator